MSAECFFDAHNECGGECSCICHKAHGLLIEFLEDNERQKNSPVRSVAELADARPKQAPSSEGASWGREGSAMINAPSIAGSNPAGATNVTNSSRSQRRECEAVVPPSTPNAASQTISDVHTSSRLPSPEAAREGEDGAVTIGVGIASSPYYNEELEILQRDMAEDGKFCDPSELREAIAYDRDGVRLSRRMTTQEACERGFKI